MTPKELLEKHGGDPLAAAEDYDNLAWLDVPFDEDENSPCATLWRKRNAMPEPILTELKQLLETDEAFRAYWEVHATAENRASVVVKEDGFEWPF